MLMMLYNYFEISPSFTFTFNDMMSGVWDVIHVLYTFIWLMAEIFIQDQKKEYKEWQVESKKQPDFNKHYCRCEWQRLSEGLKKGEIIVIIDLPWLLLCRSSFIILRGSCVYLSATCFFNLHLSIIVIDNKLKIHS